MSAQPIQSSPPPTMLATSRPLYCRVVGLDDAAPDMRIVSLAVASGGAFRFTAGQYVNVSFGAHPPRAFSLANSPLDDVMELHVRHGAGGGVSAAYVARDLHLGDGVWVEGPFGDSWLRCDHRGPILGVAGGTGLAPIKSIIETALRLGMTQPIALYVGARDEADLYLERRFHGFRERFPHFRFVPVLSEPRGETSRRVGGVAEAAFADFRGDPNTVKVYLAGPHLMVEAGAALAASAGIPAENIHADLFVHRPATQSSATVASVSKR